MRRGKAVAALAAFIIVLSTSSAYAQLRLEGNLAWPLVLGVPSSNTLFGGESSIDISKYQFLIPDFRIYYQFGEGMVDGGIGLRVPTLLIVSAFYPEAFVELNLKPLVLEGTLGGLLFGFFGFGVTGFAAEPLLTSDINASFELAPWFRLGGGVYFFVPADSTFSQNFVYVGYISARFVFLMK